MTEAEYFLTLGTVRSWINHTNDQPADSPVFVDIDLGSPPSRITDIYAEGPGRTTNEGEPTMTGYDPNDEAQLISYANAKRSSYKPDIMKRLMSQIAYYGHELAGSVIEDMAEAADEIERLRTELSASYNISQAPYESRYETVRSAAIAAGELYDKENKDTDKDTEPPAMIYATTYPQPRKDLYQKTGAELYLEDRLKDPVYRPAYTDAANAIEAHRLLKIASDNALIARGRLWAADDEFDKALGHYRSSIVVPEDALCTICDANLNAMFDESMAEDANNLPYYAWGDEERQCLKG